MKRRPRPERIKDHHLPIARVLALQETGEQIDKPSQDIMVRAAKMQGRGADFTLEEITWRRS